MEEMRDTYKILVRSLNGRDHLEQCFSTAGLWPGTGPWDQ